MEAGFEEFAAIEDAGRDEAHFTGLAKDEKWKVP